MHRALVKKFTLNSDGESAALTNDHFKLRETKTECLKILESLFWTVIKIEPVRPNYINCMYKVWFFKKTLKCQQFNKQLSPIPKWWNCHRLHTTTWKWSLQNQKTSLNYGAGMQARITKINQHKEDNNLLTTVFFSVFHFLCREKKPGSLPLLFTNRQQHN